MFLNDSYFPSMEFFIQIFEEKEKMEWKMAWDLKWNAGNASSVYLS